ncbi:MAG: hypothetical protein ACTSQ0_05485 [Candidatus Heimdallarchaeota archaeon]
MSSPNESEDKSILFDYWKTIPFIQVLSESNPLVGSMVRMLIPKILMTGIEEEYPINSGSKQIRYAMSVREIMVQLNITAKKHFNIDKEFKLTNVYFHLEKLEEAGLIQEVASLTTGKRKKTAYFGNTAIVFIFREDSQIWRNEELLKFMTTAIPKFNKSVSKPDLEKIVEQSDTNRSEEITNKIKVWYEENKEALLESNINYHALYVYLEMMLSSTPELQKLYAQLIELLKL